jgi:ABC-type uncharacterized transport system substrate-binding protein
VLTYPHGSGGWHATRAFIAGLGSAAAWPMVARGQQPAMPVIGFLSSSSSILTTKRIASFSQGLSEAGYVAGRDFIIQPRLAENQYDRLPALAADLVNRRVNLIATLAPPAAFAAKAATTTIPIVFVAGFDPIRAGLVDSLSHPGGNVTGVTFISSGLGAKRLELVRELIPNVAVLALLTYPDSLDGLEELRDLEVAAKAIGQQLLVLPVKSESDFSAAFDSIAQYGVGAVLVGADQYFIVKSDQLIALASRYRVPDVYALGEAVASGALMSYGTSAPDAWRLAGVYAGRILKGAKPVDLPVQQPTKFELVINLKTAKYLGLTVPPTLLARADEVIE